MKTLLDAGDPPLGSWTVMSDSYRPDKSDQATPEEK
jgi:hypothetical protein